MASLFSICPHRLPRSTDRSQANCYMQAVSAGWFDYVIENDNVSEVLATITGEPLAAVSKARSHCWLQDQRMFA